MHEGNMSEEDLRSFNLMGESLSRTTDSESEVLILLLFKGIIFKDAAKYLTK